MNKKILAVAIITTLVIAVSVVLTFERLNYQPPLDNNIIAKQKIGLAINAPNSTTNVQQLQDIYLHAASTGIGRSNVYLFWNLLEPQKAEFDWKQSDILMSLNKKNDLRVTLYFSVINGNTLGPFPNWIGSNPSLSSIDQNKLIDTLDAILTRYHIIDTIIISGSAAEYFRYDQQNIPIYKTLFENVYQKLKEKHPNVQIGNMYSLNNIINKNLEPIVHQLDVGDFIGFTYSPVDLLNDITKTPQQARQDLEYALKLANNTNNNKIAFFELSWSTSDFVNGNTQDQRQFIKQAFEFYNQHESDITFMTWYRQYDKPSGSCAVTDTIADQKIDLRGGGNLGLGGNEHVIERLGNYICSAGLLDIDGTPKPGWEEFINQIDNLGQLQSYSYLERPTTTTTVPIPAIITTFAHIQIP